MLCIGVQRRVQLLTLFFLLAFFVDVTEAHQVTVNPSQPTDDQNITIEVTGNLPEGGGPSFNQWVQAGNVIRIYATGVLPGIPRPIIPYYFDVEIGRLPPGVYIVEYYLELFAAPIQPPGVQAPPTLPVATISFQVLSAPARIPALSVRGLILLSILFLLVILLVPGRKYLASSKDDYRRGTL